jgi:hypothetical protein
MTDSKAGRVGNTILVPAAQYVYGADLRLLIEASSVDITRLGNLMIQFPIDPVFTEQFYRVLCPDRAIPAAKIVGCTVFVASPANALWMLGIERYFRFCHLCVFRILHLSYLQRSRKRFLRHLSAAHARIAANGACLISLNSNFKRLKI